jgi:hypothetical protein
MDFQVRAAAKILVDEFSNKGNNFSDFIELIQ